MKEYFTVGKIKYEGPKSTNPLAFKYYNKDEMILGKPMKEHLKFAMSWWHTLCAKGSDQFGSNTMERTFENSNPLQEAFAKVDAGFEFMEKLGIEYFCFHDRDMAPELATLKESNEALDKVSDYVLEKMKETKIKCLWGSREGYDTLLNTDVKQELDHYATLLTLARDYNKKSGLNAQLLIEPKPKEPTKHQYDFDVQTVLGFLKTYGLEQDFKMNIEANHATLAIHTFNHELAMARIHGVLGSIDANQGDMLLGWDTDQFPTNLYDAVLAMYEVLLNDGLGKGGLNFDAKVRRQSFTDEDLFISYIAGMDTFARGLRVAARLLEDKVFESFKATRYASYTTGIGKKIAEHKVTLEELSEYALAHDEIHNTSGRQEWLEAVLNQYL